MVDVGMSRVMLVNVEGREDDIEQFFKVAVDPWYDPTLRDENWGDGRIADGVEYVAGRGTDLVSFRVTVPVGIGNPAKAFPGMLVWFEDLVVSYWMVDTRSPSVAEYGVYEGGKPTDMGSEDITETRFEQITGFHRASATTTIEEATVDYAPESDSAPLEDAIHTGCECLEASDFGEDDWPMETEMTEEEWAEEAVAAFEFAALPMPWLEPYRKPEQLSFDELLEAA